MRLSGMARMHFHLNECGVVTDDPEGREVANLATAREIAISAAREVMCAELAEGRLCMACHIDVIGAGGARLLHVPFAEAVVITGI